MAKSGPRTFEGIVGRLRSTLGAHATARAWMKIVTLLEGLEDEELDKTLDYLAPALEHWRCDEAYPWLELSGEPLKETPFWWVDPLEPTLRIAPSDWVYQALSPQPCPQMRLVEAVDLSAYRSGPENKGLIHALDSEHLSHVKALRLGSGHNISMTAYHHLATGAGTRGLERLSVGDFRRKHLKALEWKSHLDIRHLCVHATTTSSVKAFVGSDDGMLDDEVLGRFLESSWFANLEALSLEASAFSIFKYVRERGIWPDLHTIELRGTFNRFRSYGADRNFHVSFERAPRCHTLRLVNPYYPDDPSDITLALNASPQNVTHLDLSAWLPPRAGVTMAEREEQDPRHETFRKQLRIRLPTSRLLASVEEVTLGHWHSDLFAADIEHHGTRVVG